MILNKQVKSENFNETSKILTFRVCFVYIVYWTIKKAFKKFGLKTWCTKKPFGYRVVHHIIIDI